MEGHFAHANTTTFESFKAAVNITIKHDWPAKLSKPQSLYDL